MDNLLLHVKSNPISVVRHDGAVLVPQSESQISRVTILLVKKVSSGILHLTYIPAVTGTLRNFFCNCGARLAILWVTIEVLAAKSDELGGILGVTEECGYIDDDGFPIYDEDPDQPDPSSSICGNT